MQFDMTSAFKTAARSGYYVVSRMVGFFMVGLALNVALLLLMWPEMSAIIGHGGGGFGHMSGPGSGLIALVLVVAYWPMVLMLAGFGGVFPGLYFFFGQRHGIRKALHHVLNDNREAIGTYTTERLWNYVARKSGLKDGSASVPLSTVLQLLPQYLKTLDNMPRPIRMVARHYMKKVDFDGVVSRAIEQQRANGKIDFDSIERSVRQTANEAAAGFLEPDLRWFAILLSVNLAAFVLIKMTL